MAKSDFDFSPGFFEALGNSPSVLGLCLTVGNGVMATAVQSAPVDTHDYVNSIHIEVRQSRYRKVVRVVASDRKALLIEAKKGVLARALKAHGRGSIRRSR